jgi:hypothetical protein
VKDLQQRDLTPQQRLAAQVRSLPRRCVNCAGLQVLLWWPD